MQALPETLPEDFSEWDSGHAAATLSAGSGREPASGRGAASKPQTQAPTALYKVLYPLDGSTDIPRFTARSFYAADERILRTLRFYGVNLSDPKSITSKIMTLSVVSMASILLLHGLLPRIDPGLRPRLDELRQSIGVMPLTTDESQAANMVKPSPSKLLTTVLQTSASETTPSPSTQLVAGSVPATDGTKEAAPPPVQSKMMTDQLAAAKQIPHDITAVARTDAPPSAAFGGAELTGMSSGGGNLMGSVFGNGSSGPKVKVVTPAPIRISSGLAVGMLVHKTAPLYPDIAKFAHVFGTVVLQATVSKEGTIENLRVISGPNMLRQAALEAVKSWRYKPYLLNGDPVQVDTTVNVSFNPLGE